MVTHPAYLQIIGMGKDAIPLLMNEMNERPDHWDWAVCAITGADPVPAEAGKARRDRGRVGRLGKRGGILLRRGKMLLRSNTVSFIAQYPIVRITSESFTAR